MKPVSADGDGGWPFAAWLRQWALLPLCLLLCFLYAADTMMVAASLHWYQRNPTSAQMILLAELVKLAMALAFAMLDGSFSWHPLDKPCSISSSNNNNSSSSSESSSSRSSSHASKQCQPDAEPSDQLPLLPHSRTYTSISPSQASTPWERLQQQLQQPGWLSQLLHFSVPALCYFSSNNLSFYALRVLPAYTYMLLTSLKILTTALLSATLLDKDIPQRQQLSYVLMLLAVNLGCVKGSTTSNSPFLSYNIPLGLFIMLVVAGCSALATVYTEWVMNCSCYKHEPINMQNARLYAAGIVLNGALYLWDEVKAGVTGASPGASKGSWGDIQLLHVEIITSLAFMGLLVSLIIKFHGSGVKVMASAIAMFAAAWASQALLKEPAPALFWAGAALAGLALLLHNTQGSAAGAGSSSGAGSPAAEQQRTESQRQRRSVVLLWVALFATLVACGLLSTAGGARVSSPSRSLNSTTSPLYGPWPHDPTIRVPAEFLPIDFPGSYNVCAHLNCSFAAECTVHNPGCCAFYHANMLDFLVKFTAEHHLEKEYFAVYGAVVGALRHPGGLLPWTNDLDLGASPKLIAALESTALRDSMWQYGYYFYKANLWKLCAHPFHPDPIWRQHFKQPVVEGSYRKPVPTPGNPRPGYKLHVRSYLNDGFIDFWPAAPLGSVKPGNYFHCRPLPCPPQANSVANQQLWHLYSNTGWVQVTFKRKARIGGVFITIPDNAEENMALVYGQQWRYPNTTYHGKWAPEGWWAPREAPFDGAPDAVTMEQVKAAAAAKAAAKAATAAAKAAKAAKAAPKATPKAPKPAPNAPKPAPTAPAPPKPSSSQPTAVAKQPAPVVPTASKAEGCCRQAAKQSSRCCRHTTAP